MTKHILLFIAVINLTFSVSIAIPLNHKHHYYQKNFNDDINLSRSLILQKLFNDNEETNLLDSDTTQYENEDNVLLVSVDGLLQRNSLLRKRRHPLECIQRDDAGHCIQYARPHYPSSPSS